MTVFTRLYLMILLILLCSAVGLAVLVDQVNRYRFAHYVEGHQQSLQTIIEYNQLFIPDERQADWINIISRLTGADWTVQDEPTPNFSRLNWWSQSAQLGVMLNNETTIQAELTDWNELVIGLGFLMTNALSLRPANARSDTLANMSRDSGLITLPVRLDNEPLGFLQQRQLNQGQAVLVPTSGRVSGAALYIPMGQGNALRIGSIATFEWITPYGLVLLTLLGLTVVALLIYLALKPLKARFAGMTQAVDDIKAGKQNRVPELPADELGTLGAHINRMADDLLESAQHNRALNQSVSHDLKTPVAQLMFALELLGPTKEQADVVSSMRRSVAGMSQLIDELLAYHRLSASQADIRRDRVKLAELLLDLQQEYSMAYSGIEIEVTGAPENPTLETDPLLLKRLLQNLLDNACRFGQQKVNVAATTEPGQICLLIDDDGPGIPEPERRAVFQPFYQLDPSRGEHGGHGLGLAICREICTSLNGKLSIEDADLGGCRFRLYLPLLHTQT